MKLLRPLSAERWAVSSYSSPKNRRFALLSTGETGPLKSTSSCLVRSLRQAFATLDLVAGINPKVVSEALGHSGVTITLDLYSHVLPNMQAELAGAVANILKR